jgi:hypothetical protein
MSQPLFSKSNCQLAIYIFSALVSIAACAGVEYLILMGFAPEGFWQRFAVIMVLALVTCVIWFPGLVLWFLVASFLEWLFGLD